MLSSPIDLKVYVFSLIFIFGGRAYELSNYKVLHSPGLPAAKKSWLRTGMFVDAMAGPKTWKPCRVLHVTTDGKVCHVVYTETNNVERNVDVKDRIKATRDTFARYEASRLEESSLVPGVRVTGVVTKLDDFAAFVDIGSETEAFLGYLEANLSDLKVGQEVAGEIAAHRSGRYQLAAEGTFSSEDKALHRLHAWAAREALGTSYIFPLLGLIGADLGMYIYVYIYIYIFLVLGLRGSYLGIFFQRVQGAILGWRTHRVGSWTGCGCRQILLAREC